MKDFKLPEKVRRFVVPGILVFAVLLFAGGLYFRNQSLIFSPQIPAGEEEGGVAGVRTSIPQNFPQDIPLFEPVEIVSSLESQERIQITLQTDSATERVLQFYQRRMKDLGWRLTGRGEDNGILTFLKNDRRAQLVITSEPEGPTLIILSVTP